LPNYLLTREVPIEASPTIGFTYRVKERVYTLTLAEIYLTNERVDENC